MVVNLEGKHLVGPDSTGTTVLPTCIIQTSPLLYFTLPSLSHVNEPRHGGRGVGMGDVWGKQGSWIKGAETLEQDSYLR